MKRIETLIEIESILEFLSEQEPQLSEKETEEFVSYLESDFYDWLKTNFQSYLEDREI